MTQSTADELKTLTDDQLYALHQMAQDEEDDSLIDRTQNEMERRIVYHQVYEHQQWLGLYEARRSTAQLQAERDAARQTLAQVLDVAAELLSCIESYHVLEQMAQEDYPYGSHDPDAAFAETEAAFQRLLKLVEAASPGDEEREAVAE
jgi:hypothetical protein